MFCLRSWVPLLLFLTNASPLYILLFLTGTYLLQRPCIYCSLLLLITIYSLFDFHADWFEPRSTISTTAYREAANRWYGGNVTLMEAALETAGLAMSSLNGTGGSVVSSLLDGARQRLGSSAGIENVGTNSTVAGLRSLVEKWQFRIPCVDVTVRL